MPRPALLELDKFIEVLGFRLDKLDHIIIASLAERMELARLVEEWKHHHDDQPILRQTIEDKRLNQVTEWAKEKGLDPNFARSLFYLIICESCKVQVDQLQGRSFEQDALYEANREEWYQILKKNLLKLTTEVASSYDDDYIGSAPFATNCYLEFEKNILRNEVSALRGLENKALAIELGCATGRIVFELAPDFDRVIGYDISEDMIAIARNKNGPENVEFIKSDIDDGIPVDAGSTSLVVMNFGTASSVRYIKKLINGLKRVLKKDGRFLLSFYNTGALFYQFFIPWSVGLTAKIDTARHCLNVCFNEQLFQIYARPYTIREIKNLFIRENALTISKIKTYPTIAAILPDEFFKEDASREAIKKIDHQLANQERGAYILVTGRKTSD